MENNIGSKPVDITIVTGFGKDWVKRVKRLITSIRKKTVYPYKIIIFDGHGKTQTENYNKSLRKSKNPFILFLDDDTVVGTNYWLSKLMARFVDERVGAVCPLGAYSNQMGIREDQIDEFAQSIENAEDKTDLLTLSGYCLLVRKDVFDKIGRFDTQFVHYFQDADLCYRMRAFGYKIIQVNSVFVWHEGGAGTPKDERYLRIADLDQLRFEIKWEKQFDWRLSDNLRKEWHIN